MPSLSTPKEPVAIIGSGCRFPGACNSPSRLWDLLKEPKDLRQEIPSSRFSPDGHYHPNNAHHGTSNVRHSYLLSEDHRHFDAQFFGIKPVEANSIDPQQRILMETVYESIESAGLKIEDLQGSQTAVYVGLMCGDYSDMLMQSPESIPMYMATGTARSIIANRISYFFDWHGPCMTIDTACSSSLVALHHAVQAVRSGESRAAVAAGSNLCLNPEPYIAESKLKMLSPTGRSRMWDADADGYARGDGVASVIVKTLSAALEDGDHIECIVRETGVNQDGRTKGITMPSSTAQAALIRATYARAGLDPSKASDRPQFFEAHGTGTPTGDPLEAAAISSTFYGDDYKGGADTTPLYVGSIKTVVGHTEGTAGLAGVIKASLALRDGIIPPNLHFTTLNPAITQYYSNLKIPTERTKWPSTAEGSPRRASVNSFGFGGTNAHAILESYNGAQPAAQLKDQQMASFAPLAFSAHTEAALYRMLEKYAELFKEQPELGLRDVAYTLNTRRSQFAYRTAVVCSSRDTAGAAIEAHLQKLQDGKAAPGNKEFRKAAPQILGVFTGQGAQWATMGKELILTSPAVAADIASLEQRLEQLPEADRPTWSLREELLKAPSASRIGEATLSQPLCTAIQVVLVNLLHSAGIKFRAVVGHSSGEIGAAYAAGLVSDTDAICIAYYRGLYSRLATGAKGEQGRMMAVGTSEEDAIELCNMPEFEGRLSVAAVNSSSSVTLSGDADAIQEAKDILDDEKKFARVLAVDKAYHSHHMMPCASTYEKALLNLNIQIQTPQDSDCTWYSSVDNTPIAPARDDLTASYWVANMVQAVRFSQAIELACTDVGAFDMAIELGPHPALKGPATQTIKEIIEGEMPYVSTLRRGMSAVDAIADGLAELWTHLGPSNVTLGRFDAYASDNAGASLVKTLPQYPWQHDRVFWHEARAAKVRRTRTARPNQLLGNRDTHDPDRQFRWRNTLSPSEVPYLADHKIQGQMVFPAAGYISAAVEAAIAMSPGQEVAMVELRNMSIGAALSFDEMDSKMDVLFTVTDIDHQNQDTVAAKFHFFSAPSTSDANTMVLNADGELIISYGPSSATVLPPRAPRELEMVDIDETRFYGSLDSLGYGYSGAFRSLANLKRKLGKASGTVVRPVSDDPTELFIHPATLDATIQSVMLAASWPGDGRLWSLHVPTSIESIAINPALCKQQKPIDGQYFFDTVLSPSDEPGIHGDFQIFSKDGRYTLLRMEGMHAVPLEGSSAANDRQLFTRMDWYMAHPDAEIAVGSDRATAEDYRLAELLERVAVYYYSRLEETFPKTDKAREGPWAQMLDFCSHVVDFVAKGMHVSARPDWINDDEETIEAEMNKFPENIDLRVMRIIGKNLANVVRGESNMLEHLRVDDILDDYYSQAMGTHYSEYLARIASQIADRHPHLNFLEIGAGTGSATKSIMRTMGGKFASYTFTDVSSGFFENAQETFEAFSSKMMFKVLDVEKDVPSQGYALGSYDVIVASFVLHATKRLEDTMKNVRSLLKPGGYLLLLEITNLRQARLGFIFGSLPGWWLGEDEGRRLTPLATKPKWDAILRRTGFSGIDTVTPDHDPLPWPVSVLVSQAVDDRISFLRDPLYAPGEDISKSIRARNLIIVGGTSPANTRLTTHLRGLLSHHYGSCSTLETVEDVVEGVIEPSTSVLILEDLDRYMFENLSTKTLNGLRYLFEKSENVLWVTREAHDNNPYHMMSTGFGRAMLMELPHVRTQFLDFDRIGKSAATEIAEAMLRLEINDSESSDEPDKFLWSTEPEIVIQSDRQLIPRVTRNPVQNERYNSFRRHVTREIPVKDHAVRLEPKENGYTLYDHLLASASTADAGASCTVNVQSSTLNPIKIGAKTGLYLVSGKAAETQEDVIALADCNSSIVEVPHGLQVTGLKRTGKEYLAAVQKSLIALIAILSIPSGASLLVIEPDTLLVSALKQHTINKPISMQFLTTDPSKKGSHFNYVHANAGIYEIKAALLAEPSHVICTGNARTLERKILARLPASIEVQNLGSLILSAPSKLQPSMLEDASTLLNRAAKAAETFPQQQEAVTSAVSLSTALAKRISSGDMSILDWEEDEKATMTVEPVDRYDMLKSDRTYWLVGLSRSLGLSLCRWMIKHGARYIVISSRSPSIEKKLIQELERMGATVKVYACNIVSKQSVIDTHALICRTMPKIAGVANGAMVLRDTLLADMTVEEMDAVTGPKVNGSVHLNQLFQDESLDFFIFFSSAIGVTGNVGQSNYAIANTFMHGLAAQRRKMGFAASAIVIGVILGVGYVTRETTQALQDNLLKSGHTWMSEQDFHTLFAEAIVAGAPRPENTSEIISGLKMIDAADSRRPPWSFNPKFQHLVASNQAIDDSDASKQGGRIPLKTQLLEANSKDEVFSILEEGLAVKVSIMLQLNDSITKENMLNHTSEDLGIDSLNAVDLRTWFVKDVKVDIPVLRILGGSTMRDILQYAFDQMSVEVAPALDPSFQPKPKAETSKSKPAPPKNAQAESTKQQSPPASKASPAVAKKVEATEPAASAIPEPLHQATETSDLKSTLANLSASTQSLVTNGSAVSKDGSYDMIESSASSVSAGPDTDSSVEMKKKPVHANVKTTQTLNELDLMKSSDLSYGQSRFWFLQSFVEDKTTFNITCSFDLTGDLDVAKFGRAVEAIGQRHEALRTCFFTKPNGQEQQGVLAKSHLHLEHETYSDIKELPAKFDELKSHVYDLSSGDLMRIILFTPVPSKTLNGRLNRLLIGYHHINMDGVSLGVLLSELERLYMGQTLGKVFQYPDYAVQQRQQGESGVWKKEVEYWRNEFKSTPSVLPTLPFAQARQRTALTNYNHIQSTAKINSALTKRVQSASSANKVSPFHFFTTVFHTMLARWAKTNEVVLGFTDANRYETGLENSVGLYLNILPINMQYTQTKSFAASIKDTKRKVTEAILHSRIPIDVMLDELEVPRSANHNPLFQACINYRPAVNERRPFGNCQLEGKEYASGRTSYDILLDVIDSGLGDTTVVLSVQENLYDQAAANTLLKSFITLVENFAADQAQTLSRPSLFNQTDVRQAITRGTGPKIPSKWPETVVHRIDDIALRSPGSTAIKDGKGSSISYDELVRRVESIVDALQQTCSGDAPRVGVYQRASIDWICSMLAIMRIGGVYVPLDSRYSIPRLNNIIHKCKPVAIIYDSETVGTRGELGAENIEAIDVSTLARFKAQRSVNRAKATDWAAILYTSGSTGEPKGIPLSHRVLLTNYEASMQSFDIAEDEVVLQQTAFSFDLSMWQILVALCAGATLFIVPDALRRDAPSIVQLIKSQGITFTGAVPSEYASWFLYGDKDTMRESKWRRVLCGGEPMSMALQQDFQNLAKGDLRLFNIYGPTECSLYSTITDVPYATNPNPAISVGSTLANYTVVILNDESELVPSGVLGQIVIGGPGVASGYVDDAVQTRARFAQDLPSLGKHLGTKTGPVHMTGDEGWMDENGLFYIKGRMSGDMQIKLRGQRLDLREVEQAIELASNGDILEALVTVRKSSQTGLEFLVAHVRTAKSPGHLDEKAMQQLISSLPLPSYMKPSAIIPVDDFPLTHHGKRDRAAIAKLELPQSMLMQSQSDVAVDLSNVETRLLDVWRYTIPTEVLQLHQISSTSDFFLVGGNSIQLLALQAKIKEAFAKDVPLVRLFESSTLGAMASILDDQGRALTAEAIDWEAETTLKISDQQIKTRPLHQSELTVVLTGATGFLGKVILQQLIDDPKVGKIHCIAVRSFSKLDGFMESEKVNIYGGDLSEAGFGLSTDTLTAVFGEADLIIHNGAEVSFMKSYTTLRRPNVDSTHQMIQLSVNYGGIPIHYVSTAGVGWLSGQESFGEVSAADILPPTDDSNGYVASKWASERLLEKASDKFDLSVFIYRPSNITGDDVPEQDVMHNIVRYSRKVKAAPSMYGAWEGYLNFVDVEQSAGFILDNISHRAPAGNVTFVNVVGDEDIPVANLKDWLEKTDQPSWYRSLSLQKWVEKAEAAGMDPLVAAYLKRVESDFPTITLSKLTKASSKPALPKETQNRWSFSKASSWRR